MKMCRQHGPARPCRIVSAPAFRVAALGKLIAELAGPWMAQQESRLRERRGAGTGCAPRARARATTGVHRPGHRHPGHLAVPAPARRPRAVLRGGPFHDHPGGRMRSGRCSRPAASPCPASPGCGLRTLADVFAYAAAEGVHLRIDGTEVQVRRPRATGPGGGRSCPGKKKQNTDQGHRHQRRRRAAAVARGVPAGPHARRHRAAHRGHRRPAPPLPQCQSRRRRRLPGPGPRLPRPGHRPAQKPRQGRRRPAKPPLAGTAARPSPPGGSASSTPSPNPSNGGPCSATPAAASTSRKPPWPSPGWSPTAPGR